MLPAWLDTAPRTKFAHLPTPLEPMDRLARHLLGNARGPRLWVKRDDCTGLASGGNKTRKLEYLIGDARARGTDAVLTFGAVQSNHARQTAAACAAAGLPCHLILSRRVDWPHPAYERSGNVLLDQLLGAEIQLLAPAAVQAAARALSERLRRDGQSLYIIPTGGSNPVGALGYVRCAFELAGQAKQAGFELTDVLHASSSAGTQAGLIAGFTELLAPHRAGTGRSVRVHGVNVYEQDAATLHARVLELTNQVLAIGNQGLHATADKVLVDARYRGADYGIPTAETLEAIRLGARLEGLLLDPVYSGKAFAGLIDRLGRGEFAHLDNLVFLHTGGAAVLPVYDSAFRQVLHDG